MYACVVYAYRFPSDVFDKYLGNGAIFSPTDTMSSNALAPAFFCLVFPQQLLQPKSAPPKTLTRQKTDKGAYFDLICLIRTNVGAQIKKR